MVFVIVIVSFIFPVGVVRVLLQSFPEELRCALELNAAYNFSEAGRQVIIGILLHPFLVFNAINLKHLVNVVEQHLAPHALKRGECDVGSLLWPIYVYSFNQELVDAVFQVIH